MQKAIGGLIVVASGESPLILGQTTGEEYTHNVLVADDVSQGCLLGADFLANLSLTWIPYAHAVQGKVIIATSPTI